MIIDGLTRSQSFVMDEGLSRVAPHGGETVDARVAHTYFEINGQTTERKTAGFEQFLGRIIHRARHPLEPATRS